MICTECNKTFTDGVFNYYWGETFCSTACMGKYHIRVKAIEKKIDELTHHPS